MIRAVCPDCGQDDQMSYGPDAGHQTLVIGCARCQNGKRYATFPAMWAAWCEHAQPQQPKQPNLFEVAS